MGILDPRLCTLDGVARPPIDKSRNVFAHMSATPASQVKYGIIYIKTTKVGGPVIYNLVSQDNLV